MVNTRAWRAAELPAANAHTNARALARLYGAVARGGELDGYRIFSRDALPRCNAEQSNGRDEVLLFPTRFSLGFMLPSLLSMYGPSPNAFGHPGAGGSVGFADPDAKIGFGYVMNQMQTGLLVGERVTPLIAAIYDSL
jgi:CubicO group peptidase (beta-lactamase class C family)